MFVDDIWCATRRGDLTKVKEFIDCDGIPEVEDDYGFQSLFTVACEAGRGEIVRYLLENCKFELGYYSPYAFAALAQEQLEVLRILFDFGLDSDSNEYSKHGLSLLETAVFYKQREAVKLFVEYGAELKYSWWGRNPMSLVTMSMIRKSIQMLLCLKGLLMRVAWI